MEGYTYSKLFFQKYLYLISEEKNWNKAEYLVANIYPKADVPEVIYNLLSFKSKLEVGNLREAKKFAEYFVENIDKIAKISQDGPTIIDIALCCLFDYAFRVLVNQSMYDKIAENNELAIFACECLHTVSSHDTKTYKSHIMTFLEKVNKLKNDNKSYITNYVLVNYYLVMNIFNKKFPSVLKELGRSVCDNATSFILND